VDPGLLDRVPLPAVFIETLAIAPGAMVPALDREERSLALQRIAQESERIHRGRPDRSGPCARPRSCIGLTPVKPREGRYR